MSRGTQDPSCSPRLSSTGLSPSLVALSNVFESARAHSCAGPTTPPLSRDDWFGLFPVRSPLLRESRLISFRRATEMFQFTHCPPSLPMYSAGGLQTSLWRGCPIRNLRVHRLHAAPPERFAGLRVLLRPSAPRHPPRTLSACSPLLTSLLLACSAPVLRHTPALAFLCFFSCCPRLASAKLKK